MGYELAGERYSSCIDGKTEIEMPKCVSKLFPPLFKKILHLSNFSISRWQYILLKSNKHNLIFKSKFLYKEIHATVFDRLTMVKFFPHTMEQFCIFIVNQDSKFMAPVQHIAMDDGGTQICLLVYVYI